MLVFKSNLRLFKSYFSFIYTLFRNFGREGMKVWRYYIQCYYHYCWNNYNQYFYHYLSLSHMSFRKIDLSSYLFIYPFIYQSIDRSIYLPNDLQISTNIILNRLFLKTQFQTYFFPPNMPFRSLKVWKPKAHFSKLTVAASFSKRSRPNSGNPRHTPFKIGRNVCWKAFGASLGERPWGFSRDT